MVTTAPIFVLTCFNYPDREAPTIPDPKDHVPATRQMSAQTLALSALGWILQDTRRAERYLELTGLDADELRVGLKDERILASSIDFLANYERDLISAAEALAITPEELIHAREELNQ